MSLRSVVAIVAVCGFALPSLATVKTVTIARRTPINQFCPIDNRENDLTFVAEQAEVRITIQAFNSTAGGLFIQNRFDNIAVIDKASYDAHQVVAPGFEACYGAPGDPNAPALDFNASGTFERYLMLFDGTAAGWEMSGDAFYQSGPSAPRNPALGTDTTGGALAFGVLGDGNVVISATIQIPNLTPGTQYVMTGWWYVKSTSRPLTVKIDTAPCRDGDADGVLDCAGDCNDNDIDVKPGAPEWCDGVDNDCDGEIDEDAPCDRVCDVPQVLLSNGRLTTTAAGSKGPSIAWNGNRYTVRFLEGDTATYVAQAYSDGSLVEAAHPAGPTPVPGDAVVWTGKEYGRLTGASNGAFLNRFAPDGTLLGGGLIGGSGPGSAQDGWLAWNGTRYGAVWLDGNTTLKFARVNPLSIGSGTAVQVGATGMGGTAAIAAAGSEFGIAWTDRRNGADPEIYFTRIGSNGQIGPDLRVTNAAGLSFDPTIAWSGSEWGIAWDDLRTGNEEIWFARIAANGAKLGSDVLVSNAPGNSRTPSIVWAGGKYGIAWSDDRNSVNDEIYFTPLGCDCVDGDGDGSSSCVDCADGNPSVYPGAAQVTCNGVPNDCNNPVWPTPLGVIDEDSDGFAPCEGDCNDANASVWATPGEAGPLTLTHDPSTGITTLFWLSPASPGTTAPSYDTIRSSSPGDFSTAAVCVEQNGGGNTVSSDAAAPASGAAFYYLIRAENLCPGAAGIGPLGTNSAGVPRTARTCP